MTLISDFRIVPVENPQQAILVAMVRNLCRRYMTNDTSEISPVKQVEWYYSLPSDERLYLCLCRCLVQEDMIGISAGDVPVGWGYISLRNGKAWLTGGLVAEARGWGYGRKLFGFMIDQVREMGYSEVWLEVKKSNISAFSLYTSLGFKESHTYEDRIVMYKEILNGKKKEPDKVGK